MSLVATLTQPLRSRYTRQMDKNEVRASRYGAWDLFNKDTNLDNGILTPENKAALRNSFGNTVQIPVMPANSDVTISNIRSCTIPDAENNSALITVTWMTFAFSITMYPAQYRNNDVGYQADYTRKLDERLIKLAGLLDTQAIATLEANKNQFWTGISGVPYAVVANALQISQALLPDFYNTIPSILARMDFYDRGSDVLTSPHAAPYLNRARQDDAEAFQFDGYNWWMSNRIVPGAGIQSAGYLMRPGSVAVQTRIDPDAEAGSRIGEFQYWDSITLPIPGSQYGIRFGVFYRKDCADGTPLHSGMTGLTRTLREAWEFSFDIAFISVYNSNIAGRFNPIIKFEISNA